MNNGIRIHFSQAIGCLLLCGLSLLVLRFIWWSPSSHWLVSHLWLQPGTRSRLWPDQGPSLPPWCWGTPSKAGKQNVASNLLLGSISRNCRNVQSIPLANLFHASNLVRRQHFRRMRFLFWRGFSVFLFFATTLLFSPLWYWPSRVEKGWFSQRKIEPGTRKQERMYVVLPKIIITSMSSLWTEDENLY